MITISKAFYVDEDIFKPFVFMFNEFWNIFADLTGPLLAEMTERCRCSGLKYTADSVFFLSILCHICLFLPVMKWAVILAQTDRSDPFSFSISISSPLTSCPADVFITDILVWWWDRQKIGGKGEGGDGSWFSGKVHCLLFQCILKWLPVQCRWRVKGKHRINLVEVQFWHSRGWNF